jgi:hypothetical protein
MKGSTCSPVTAVGPTGMPRGLRRQLAKAQRDNGSPAVSGDVDGAALDVPVDCCAGREGGASKGRLRYCPSAAAADIMEVVDGDPTTVRSSCGSRLGRCGMCDLDVIPPLIDAQIDVGV